MENSHFRIPLISHFLHAEINNKTGTTQFTSLTGESLEFSFLIYTMGMNHLLHRTKGHPMMVVLTFLIILKVILRIFCCPVHSTMSRIFQFKRNIIVMKFCRILQVPKHFTWGHITTSVRYFKEDICLPVFKLQY